MLDTRGPRIEREPNQTVFTLFGFGFDVVRSMKKRIRSRNDYDADERFPSLHNLEILPCVLGFITWCMYLHVHSRHGKTEHSHAPDLAPVALLPVVLSQTFSIVRGRSLFAEGFAYGTW